jgi:hypothetical protein
MVPAQRVVREQPDDDERRDERHEPDRHGRPPLAPELRHVDLRPGLEREHDPRERTEEREPGRDGEVEHVADDHAREELDQRDRQADLDADHRRDEDRRRQKCCYRDVAHCPYLLESRFSW